MNRDAKSPVGIADDAPLLAPPAGEEVESASLTGCLRLLLAWVACVLCGGILPGQALFTQLFVDAGMFKQVCGASSSCQYMSLANLFGVLQTVAFAAALPAGLCFDAVGARFVALFGAGLLLIGILLICVSLQWGESQVLLFPVGVLVTDFGSIVNSWCLFGFLFHLPGWNGLLVSLSNCSYYISASLPVLLQYMLDQNLVPSLSAALLLYGMVGVAMASVPVFWFAVPSQREYYAKAQEVLGMPLPRPPGANWRTGSLATYFGNLYMKAQVSNKMRLAVKALTCRYDFLPSHMYMLAASVAGNLACFVYLSMPTLFGELLFDSASAGQNLATLMSNNLCLLGAIVGPLTGVVMDKAGGLFAVLGANGASLLIVALFCFSDDWSRQALAVSGVNFFQVTNMMMLMKYIIAFAWPTRVGTVTGLFLALFAVLYIPFMFVFSGIMELLSGEGIRQYTLPTFVASTLAAALFLGLGLRIRLPSEPPMLPEDELELSRRFLVGNLDDAAEVLNLPRSTLLRLSASTSVIDMRELALRTSRSSGRLFALACRKTEQMVIQPRPRFSAALGQGWRVTDRTVSAEVAIALMLDSFWPPKGAAAGGNPLLTRYISSGAARETMPELEANFSFQMRNTYHAACKFGHLLELWLNDRLAALLFASPPGVDGATGSPAFFVGIADSGEVRLPPLRPEQARKFMELEACFEQHRPKMKHWYVSVLGTATAFRGQGCAPRLLGVVHEWASRDGVPTYLETDADTAAGFYERKAGFRRTWTDFLEGETDADSPELVGLMRP